MKAVSRIIDSSKLIQNVEYYANLPHRKYKIGKIRIKSIWLHMIDRCYGDPKYSVSYKRKQIKICDEWLNSFESFYQWSIANGYSDDLTIDRINNDGDYEPSNCQWLTLQEHNKKSAKERKFKNNTTGRR